MTTSERPETRGNQPPGLGSSPLVSVVIPAFNAQRFIEETLATVAAQSYRPLQVFIVDDGSTDQTTAIVRDWIRLLPRIGT